MAETDTETYEAWLKRKEEESRTKQNAFMNEIAQKLNRPRVMEAPSHPFRGAPDFWKAYEWTEEERIERFTANFKAASGFVERLTDLEEAKCFIAKKAEELSAHYIVRQNQPELNGMGLEEALPDAKISVWNSDSEQYWKARAAEADFGVVVADHAAAYTGSVTVLSSGDKGRSVSLLPTVLFIILPLERLKTRLGEILIGFDEAGRERLPAGIHFISGPSRSSDIENALTIGVHGPGVVYALLVG
ncbi:lactate utilization protein C [Paenibacillus sp. NPDC058071]|uniref:LutC/YkgG family protein n=1 Tax=Paenibacillus sp. NPDC058071 TaxID=3346326 RepID=UPI0036DE2B16